MVECLSVVVGLSECCWLTCVNAWFSPGYLLFVQVSIDYRPVHMQPLDSEMEQVPPKARVY